MKDKCIIIPTIKVNGEEVVSELFTRLADYTGNELATRELWALSQIPEFVEELSLEYDSNGEPTFESFNKAINIKEYLEGNISLNGARLEAGAIDKKGETILYSNADEAVDKAISFNEKNSDKAAYIEEDNGKFVVKVKETTKGDTTALEVIFNKSLNNKLLGILRSLGLDAAAIKNSKYIGMFSPVNATAGANGLVQVILIAEGEIGEEAFPEEFAHVMIAGMGEHPLVIRLMNSLTEEAVEEILGDQYSAYYNKYSGDTVRLRKEAAGQLLAKYIKGEEVVAPQYNSLLSRIWNWIKDKLGSTNISEVMKAINEANRDAGTLANLIMNEDISVNKDLIMIEKPLYNLGNTLEGMEKLSNEALLLLSKRLKILSSRRTLGKYTSKEIENIKRLQDLIERKKYTESIVDFLKLVRDELDRLQDKFDDMRDIKRGSTSDLQEIKSIALTLRSINEFSQAYEPIIRQLMALNSMRLRGEVDIEESDAKRIEKAAAEAFGIINTITLNYATLRFDTVFNFLKIYWGEDKIIEMGKKKGETITLEQIMKLAEKDINGIDRFISSMADASDPMLSLVAKAVKVSHSKRDTRIASALSRILAAHKKLKDSGVTNTDFMFEKDSEGKLTGRLISDINFEAFNRDRNAFIQKLKDLGKSKYAIMSKVEAWERRHMEEVKVDGSRIGRTEKLPSKSLYPAPSSVEDRLSPAQYEYYKTMMREKALLEDEIPRQYASTYTAIQISKDSTEILSDSANDPQKALKLMKSRLKSKFKRVADDTGYGQSEDVVLDFTGNKVERLPIYYTTPLANPEMLSTDFTASLSAYAGTTINYSEMNEIVDVLELTRDLIKEREVLLTSGDNKLEEAYQVLSKKFRKSYTVQGNKSNIGSRIDSYFASVVYDRQKEDERFSKQLDALKNYTGVLGLGLNLFSAISNVTIGKLQMLYEIIGKEHFRLKDAIIAKKNYYKDLPAYLAELNSVLKKSKMSLLIDKFDALEDFYSGLQNNKFYKGSMSRIIGNSNLFFLNTAGEHYLHTKTMLAMLNAYKVKDGNDIKSLYDVMDVAEENGAYFIKVKEGVTKLDGSDITEEDLLLLKMKIGRINQGMHGAFNEDDKGEIHRYALGRLAMQFRQWMPAFYQTRFGKQYYDPVLERHREGFYNTIYKFIRDTSKDIIRGKFEAATRLKELSDSLRANLKKALAELTVWGLLITLIPMMGPEKDKKGSWFDRMVMYQLKRMRMEVGAAVPIDPGFVKNLFTILQSPSASIKSFNGLLNCLEFWNMFTEIQSGRYKGWSEWSRDVSLTFPIYGQIRRVTDLSQEDYMFTLFNK